MKEGKIVMKKFYQCFDITLFLVVITQLAYANMHEGLVRCYRFFGNTNVISMNHISESGAYVAKHYKYRLFRE